MPDDENRDIAALAGLLPARVGREVAPLHVLCRAQEQGIGGALVTIVGIEGGAPKALGAHLAVLEDGRHVGHLSGGCVEPAIAAEVVAIAAAGRDRIIRFGRGSPFIDIRFPCGGGVDLLIHAAPDPALLKAATERADRRHPFAIRFDPGQSRATLVEDAAPTTGWVGEIFLRRYLPRTRLLLAGRGADFEVMARVAAAAEFDLHLMTPDESSVRDLSDLGVPIDLLRGPDRPPPLPIDPWTASVLLFHEHHWEDAILAQAAGAGGLYLGALGSVRTQAQRRERLAARGLTPAAIDRIRGPIGLIDRAREPAMLAISVLAEIAAERVRLDRA